MRTFPTLCRVVVVSDPKWVKEMFGEITFSGRRFFEGFEMYENEPLGKSRFKMKFVFFEITN